MCFSGKEFISKYWAEVENYRRLNWNKEKGGIGVQK